MIAAVILAAGGSSRFGSPKALFELDGSTLLRRTIRCALDGGCDPILVILGAEVERCRDAAAVDPVEIVINADWEEGMGSSIRAGIAAVEGRPGVRGALLLTCDQPLLTSSLVADLRIAFEDVAVDSPRAAVVCGYAGTRGIPALFGAALFDALRQLHGDRGAKSVFEADADRVRTVDWPDGAVDIDRLEDLDGLPSRS